MGTCRAAARTARRGGMPDLGGLLGGLTGGTGQGRRPRSVLGGLLGGMGRCGDARRPIQAVDRRRNAMPAHRRMSMPDARPRSVERRCGATHPALMDAAARPSPPPASAGSSKRSRSSGCPRSGPTARRTSSRSGSGGTAGPCSSFSKPDAQKVRNLRANPSVMLALGDAEDDFDVGLLEGRAELLDRPTREVLPAGLCAKYAARLTRHRASTPRSLRADLFAGHPDRARRLPRLARPARHPTARGWPERRRSRSMSGARTPTASRVTTPIAAGATRRQAGAGAAPSAALAGRALVRGLRGLTGGFGERRALPVGSL